MKEISFILMLFLPVISGCKSTKPSFSTSPESGQSYISEAADLSPAVNFSEQSTWLLGYFSQRQLTSEPHSLWYMKGYDSYRPDKEAISQLQEVSKDGLTIKIVMGTWCPDSRREVPRFMKILDIWHFSPENITFIGVDNAKLSPVGEYEKLSIERVPTFILYRKNIEAGRIIEVPVTSLEQDMVNILVRNEN